MAATMTAPPRWRSTREGNFLGAARHDAGQHGRLSVHLRALRADLSVRDAARRRLQDAGDLLRGEGGVHQHRAGGRLSRRRAGRRRRSCWNAWSMLSRTTPGMDRVEIRRKNFIPADAFPYQTPVALQYDSGDYQATLDACAEGRRLRRLRGAPARGGGARASCAASASPPTSRPAASRRSPWWARSARAPGCTRSPTSGCIRPAA